MQGRYSEAEPLLTDIVEARRRILGEDHPDTLASINSAARLYYAQGRYAEAELLFTRVLEARRRVLREDHPDAVASTNDLAMVYHAQHKDTEAEPLFINVLAVRRRQLGSESPATTNTMISLAELLLDERRYFEAESLLREVLEAQKKRTPDGWELYDTQSLLGASLAGQARFAEAEPLLLIGYDGLVRREATIPSKSQSIPEQAGGRLVRLYQGWGKPEKAAEWREKLQTSAPVCHH